MKAIIVAGGRGERLRPITDHIPKPMVLVQGKPILEHIILLFKHHNITDIVISLCYLPEVIVNYFGDGSKFGVNITYIYESPENPLGTAGAITLAKQHISETFIVTYADILRKLDIESMVMQHKKTGSLATLHTYNHSGQNHKSIIEFSEDNILTAFTELETSKNLEVGAVWSNGSFYVFEPEIFNFIVDNKKTDFSRDVFPQLLTHNKKVSVFPSNEYFIDIGTKETLLEAELEFKQ